MNTKTKKILKNIGITLLLVLLFIAFLAFFSVRWYIEVYGEMGFDAVLYTLFNGLGGVQDGLVINYCSNVIPATLISFLLVTVILFFGSKKKILLTIAKKIKISLFPLNKIFSSVVAFMITGVLLFQAASDVGLIDYIKSMSQQSTFFQDYYVDPNTANITFPQKKRNLIYIYLESMETTFFSKEQGGALPKNQIPELYNLAKENINFSNNQDVGGFKMAVGASWTISALVSHTSGLPLKLPSNYKINSYGEDSFLPGVTNINDVLKANGYYQTFMIGSYKKFAHRDQYFTQHGVDHIYDLDTARADGIVPPKYHQWWGMEDKHLYNYAKQELPKIAAKNQPFNFTMLTVDTHHTDGYFCSECQNTNKEQYDNVYNCASRQLNDFIEWVKQQDFYENTTIVICGDHATMDNGYIERNAAGHDRHIYNCFMNSSVTPKNTKNRLFTATDLFPSTLAAMGCTFDGDRLGVGTNLFSDSPTIPEEMGGLQAYNVEVAKNSSYYLSNFLMD